MTPTPPSASASSNGQYSPDGQYRIVRKRNRVPLSCAPCRNRKLKCNRSQPCENCIKRGDAMSCSYAAPGTRKKQASSSSSGSSPDGMQNRIDRLEGLVLSLMTNGSQSAGPAAATRALSMSESTGSSGYPQDGDVDIENRQNGMSRGEGDEGESETDQVAQSIGLMRVDNNKSMYIADSHWATILSDITEVKNYFAEHKKQYEEQMQKVEASKEREGTMPHGPTFLYGGQQPMSYQDLVANLPEKRITDMLVTRYFNSLDPAVHVLHPPSWMRTYERHWQDPSKTGPVFLGQISAVLCLALYSYSRLGDEPAEFAGTSRSAAAKYWSLTAQCIQLADWTKPINQMIEALVLHLHGEYARSPDSDLGIWVMVGMIVRLAMRMGYHRDPKYYPNITPFQGELRRRVWTFVRQSDLLFSFQIGLPSMIRLCDCDTDLPRNIYDDEIDEETTVLPPSRPATEPTPVSYMITKASMAYAFSKVVEQLHSVHNKPYEEVLALDQTLEDAQAQFPPHLRLKSLNDSGKDPATLIIQRFNLSILYNKGQCVLHRKFLIKAHENPRFAHSRRTCVNSSMALLDHQATLHYESKIGRRLHGRKVFTSSMSSHDFLLAAMILCLDLCFGTQTEGDGRRSGDMYTWGVGVEKRADMIKALEVSHEIWCETKDQSMEAYKGSEVLGVILKKLHSQSNQMDSRQASSFLSFPGSANGVTAANNVFGTQVEEKPEHSAAMTLGMLSNGGMTPGTASMFNSAFPAQAGAGSSLDETTSSGLAPDYSMSQQANGIAPASSPGPFSFFNNGNVSMDMPPTNVDWDAWDSYVQNAGGDPANQAWSMGIDIPLSMPAPEVDPQLQPPTANMYSNPSGGFGANSQPSGNSTM